MEDLKFINIGFGNMVNARRVIAIVSPESAPIKRMIQETIKSENKKKPLSDSKIVSLLEQKNMKISIIILKLQQKVL